jgi:DNA-binding response OmpR family regulator
MEGNPMRILLAEDEQEMSNALTTILKHNNFSVDAVYDGQDAYDYLQSEIYDAVILDIMMPKMDGLTVLRKIRSEGNAVPVLLLTAKSEIDDKVTGLDLGADDYLTKPFSSDELLARVRALSRRKGELKEDSVTFGDLTLNKKNCELQSSTGEAIKLSLKEYQILDLLFENPHQIITKEQLIEKIWGGDSNAEYNNVEVYISFIRKKIENLKVGIRIRTARGIGYSLEDETR